ncbi:hypothetical protein [Mucilaginibacter myungsuensis]|uniref:Nucleotidyltransferase DUF2204 n=1 Tax=Mucilaginibacter myungsuensis TaxID=649104 RepID=A0A929L0X4_9SPHI|nr:hypothetical protein [Mucilaginibacter myungsuensis]MBE9663548.1 hypothetical protein [Mucilaginibacter myungsuensis]MDN3600286.1 hypothetical protein [Mucilaginibacter myungsuensis]
MDAFDDAIVSFWKTLRLRGVKYIVIGGFAVNLHGYFRFTDDLDIWIDDTSDNCKALQDAFIDSEVAGLSNSLSTPVNCTQGPFLLPNSLRLELHVRMHGLEDHTFNECLALASIADIESVEVPFLNLNQLVQNKKTFNRPLDQLDVDALEQIIKIREEE